jgi:hypothetical protein
LVADDFLQSQIIIEPGQPIDFRKTLAPSRPRRPFHLKGIAGETRQIEIRLERPTQYGLAASLPYRPQRDHFTGGDKAGLLGEFAPRRRQRISVRIGHAFGDGPGAVVLLRPKRSAWMGEENLKPLGPAERKQSGADLGSAGHGLEALMIRRFGILA